MKERPDNPRKPKPPHNNRCVVGLIPQDPTTCLSATHSPRPVPHPTTKGSESSTRPRRNHGQTPTSRCSTK
ncbi:hypothetical protein F4554_006183 [Actinopolymorpha rutila]|uniref:Uncharacterized protein n=1 Tax=Actinopolymorpha rutila TaxID=446787 RepID=A0A852ZAT7_9ACTN|nr:hypothetical protein [Actinopolymorpha rutila]NYH93545.1 hypothetical protein [Actinopolymorpha rutila]